MADEWYRNFTAHIKADPDEIIAIERVIAGIQNSKNVGKTRAVNMLFLLGVENADQFVEGDEVILGASTTVKLYRIAKELRVRKKIIGEIAKDIGEEELVQAAVDEGVGEEDVRRILEECRPESSWYNRMQEWVDEYLGDMQPHGVEEIRTDAISAGILPGDERSREYKKRWSAMRGAVSVMGYSGGMRGVWKKGLMN